MCVHVCTHTQIKIQGRVYQPCIVELLNTISFKHTYIKIYIKKNKDIQVVMQNGENLSGGSKMFSSLCTEQSRQLPQKQQYTSEMQLSALQSQHCNMKILILFSKYTEGEEGKRKKSTINITVRTSLNSLWPSGECTNSSQSFYYNKVI